MTQGENDEEVMRELVRDGIQHYHCIKYNTFIYYYYFIKACH